MVADGRLAGFVVLGEMLTFMQWLAIALVMGVAVHLAWWLSLQGGHVEACNPYWDGCTSISRAARAASITAVSCGTPTPATMRVVQMLPGPMPTFTASAPASIRARVAS